MAATPKPMRKELKTHQMKTKKHTVADIPHKGVRKEKGRIAAAKAETKGHANALKKLYR